MRWVFCFLGTLKINTHREFANCCWLSSATLGCYLGFVKIGYQNLLLLSKYSFYGYNYFKNAITLQKDLIAMTENRYLNDNINIKNYRFLNSNQEEIQINSDKLLLVETWNETCPPCIKSINDLQPSIDSLSNSLQHIYLYESPLFGKTITFKDVMSFKPIKNKEKIIIDFEFKFFKDSGMNSYPVFLLFNQNGILLDYFTGYSAENKEYYVRRIKKMANN